MFRSKLRLRLALLVAVGAASVGAVASLALYRDVSGEVSDAITTELHLRMAELEADGGRVDRRVQRPLFAQVLDTAGNVVSPTGDTAVLDDEELRRATDGELVVDRPVPGFSGGARVLAHPIEVEGGAEVIGVTAASTAPIEHVRDRLLVVLLVATPALSAAKASSMRSFARHSRKPPGGFGPRRSSVCTFGSNPSATSASCVSRSAAPWPITIRTGHSIAASSARCGCRASNSSFARLACVAPWSCAASMIIVPVSAFR